MKILRLITGNIGKLAEFKDLLQGYELEQVNLDLVEIQEIDSQKIIEHKLQEALRHVNGPILVEDTSLHIEAFGGLPGPLIKWFEKSLSLAEIAELAILANKTKATAQVLIGLAENAEQLHYFKGELQGQIVAPRGENGFGWDKIFQPEGYDQTFGEMDISEKQKFSHRFLAVQELKKYLDEHWV